MREGATPVAHLEGVIHRYGASGVPRRGYTRFDLQVAWPKQLQGSAAK